jgi:hypothetical protein
MQPIVVQIVQVKSARIAAEALPAACTKMLHQEPVQNRLKRLMHPRIAVRKRELHLKASKTAAVRNNQLSFINGRAKLSCHFNNVNKSK